LKIQPPASNVCATPGGVEFQGRLDDCFRTNLNLRSANRILMRIHAFKSSNFRQLEKKLLALPWELYLPPGSFLNVHVTTKQQSIAGSTIQTQSQKDFRRRSPTA
jgi:putative N6-adenine-specific DNA methylase